MHEKQPFPVIKTRCEDEGLGDSEGPAGMFFQAAIYKLMTIAGKLVTVTTTTMELQALAHSLLQGSSMQKHSACCEVSLALARTH